MLLPPNPACARSRADKEKQSQERDARSPPPLWRRWLLKQSRETAALFPVRDPQLEARIVLDAYPDHVIPAKVVFIANQAQFTPKTVETKDERDKLMFRIRVRIDPERLRGRAEIVRSGVPGVAYVRTDPSMDWPPKLQASAPP